MSSYREVSKLSYFDYSPGKKIKLGAYRPDPHDANDYKYTASRYTAAELPPRVDLRQYLTPVEDQGLVGSCTANSMAGAYEYLAMRQLGTSGDVSRLFIYYNARSLDGETDRDEGTYLRNCIKVLQKMGACTELTWPYDPDSLFLEPHAEAYDEAARFLIEEAQRIDVDLYAMKHCLAEGYPFAFGLTLFDSFFRVGNKGIPMPNPESEEYQGNHAMLCVGYSEPYQVFVVRNSWGKDWGDQGYCYIPYDYMTNPDYCHDCWTIRSVTDLDFSQGVWLYDDDSLYDDESSDEESEQSYSDELEDEQSEDYEESEESYSDELEDEQSEDYEESEESYSDELEDEQSEDYEESEESYSDELEDEQSEDYEESEDSYSDEEEE